MSSRNEAYNEALSLLAMPCNRSLLPVSAIVGDHPRRSMLILPRQWAIIVPCYLMVIVLLTYFSYAALTAYLTPSFSSAYLITGECALNGHQIRLKDCRTALISALLTLGSDPYSNIPYPPTRTRTVHDPDLARDHVYSRLAAGKTTEAVDIPVSMVNRILYPPRKRRK